MSARLSIRTSNATAPVLRALLEAFARAGGFAMDLCVESSSMVPESIEQGARGDIAVLQAASIDRLTGQGIFRRADCLPFARAPIGLAVAKGAPRPPIATLDQVKAVLLNARAIAHTQSGPSGLYFGELMQRLGIEDEVRAKEVTRPGGYIAQLVADGQADIAFQQVSELMAVPGVDVLGPLPADIQSAIVSKAAIFADTQHAAQARELIAFFASRANAGLFAAAGLEQLR